MGDLLSFRLQGRTSRRHFWAGLLLVVVMGLFCEAIELALYDMTLREGVFDALIAGLLLAKLLLMLLWVALMVRRLHDFDCSGWWTILVVLFPLGGLILGCIRGDAGSNRFGAPTVAGGDPGPLTAQDTVRLLTELAQLKTSGAITDEEYEAQKKRILRGK